MLAYTKCLKCIFTQMCDTKERLNPERCSEWSWWLCNAVGSKVLYMV